jgi:hypothetical protein
MLLNLPGGVVGFLVFAIPGAMISTWFVRKRRRAAAAEAWTDGDLPNVLALVDPEVVARPLHRILFTRSEFHGPDGIREWYREMTDPWDRFEAVVEEAHPTPTGAVGLLRVVGYRGLDAGELAYLRQPDVVARRIAESRIDPVGTVLRLLDELDSAALELLEVSMDVVGGQEDRSGESLRHQRPHLPGGLGVHDGRPRDRHQHDRDVGLPRRPNGEPAEVAELGKGHVAADLEPDLVLVEGQRLLLILHPQLRCSDLDHEPSSVV